MWLKIKCLKGCRSKKQYSPPSLSTFQLLKQPLCMFCSASCLPTPASCRLHNCSGAGKSVRFWKDFSGHSWQRFVLWRRSILRRQQSSYLPHLCLGSFAGQSGLSRDTSSGNPCALLGCQYSSPSSVVIARPDGGDNEQQEKSLRLLLNCRRMWSGKKRGSWECAN